jgi:cytochrome c
MKWLRYLVWEVPAMLTASFLLGYIHPFGVAGHVAASPSSPVMAHSSIPSDVRAILATKCADCHSLATRTPSYAHFAPGSWLIERDVVKGRHAMNLSQWENDSSEQQETFKSKIAHEVRKHEMPPLQYLAIHWGARLTPDDIRALIAWAEPAASGRSEQATSASIAGDPVRGKVIFEKRCTGCHALNQNREGPHLAGVYGRVAGSVTGFDYSDALKNAHIVWNEQTLDRWLTDPQTMVPGTEMDFYVAPGERADVIAFLKRQSAKQ